MTRPDGSEIAEALRQTDSAQTRSAAIATFGKALRRGDRFRPVWDAVGGAAGLASLMAEFSVRDVRAVCWWLGCTASAEKARPERRAALGELVRLLYDESSDQRPLRPFYQNIIPACSLEVVQEWEDKHKVDWTTSQNKRLFYGHRHLYESKFLGVIFSPDAGDSKFETEKTLFCGNLLFCEEILQTLVTKEDHPRVPDDFMSAFAMPLLKRILKSRFNEETRNKFLDLVVQCLQKHVDLLATQLNLWKGGLIQYVIQRWNDAPTGSTEQLRAYLVQLVSFLPTKKRPLSLNSIHQAILSPRNLTPQTRYQLLRLLLRHMKGYVMDIEDDSEEGLARLRDLPVENDLWPATLFFSVDNEKALRLFNRLANTYPSGDFLSPASGSAGRTVLRQIRSLNEIGRGDTEVVRSLLMRDSKAKAEDPVSLERVRTLIHVRMKKAQQSRESQDRAFWAKSALNLCVATGDLETFGDTVLWARRFNKDPLTTKGLYSPEIFETTELEHLLGAVPPRDTSAAAMVTPALMKKNIRLANGILINLIETATMAVEEPGFNRHNWLSLFRLTKTMADWRLKNADSFNNIMQSSSSADSGLEIIDNLWKPTIDTLIEVEALLRRPASEALLGGSRHIEASGVYVLKGLPFVTAPVLADLATFVLDRMKACLGPEILKVRMGDVVEVVVRVARSDQPSLACPFIRDLIMNGDDNSSWHRQLVNVGFISSLPAKAARELLYTMANAMRDKMKEQNLRPKDNNVKENAGERPRESAIKVTTVKMMAQLLQGTIFIDASSSCDILIGLLAEVRHIDAQITIVSSLISTMEEPTCPPQLRARILDAFETYVVPVATQINERRPLTEADWERVTTDKEPIPDVSESSAILSLLVGRAHSAKLKGDDKMRFAQLIMSVLEQSAVNNGRWMNLFLVKNNLTLDPNERLPSAPTSLSIFVSIFQDWMDYMPASLLEMLRAIVLANLDPSPGIARITKAVRGNSNLVNSNAGNHWFAQFDKAGITAFGLGVNHAALALQYPDIQSKLERGKGITSPMLRDFVLAVAERLTIMGDTGLLDDLVSRLCQARFLGRDEWNGWRLNCVPVVKEIVVRVKAIRLDREAQWGTTTRSVPLVLPNTLRLYIMVLPIPYSKSSDPAFPEEIDAFISELSKLIDELAKRRLPYHEDFSRLKEEVLRAPRVSDFALFALKLDEMTSVEEPALADYLRLELARDLLVKVGDLMEDTVVKDVINMVMRWKNCKIEGVRVTGCFIIKRLTLDKGT
ncbi:hypothetical protein AUP68_17439 [Ilyonectria robusta]